MPKKRSLADLYVVGKELTIDDGRGAVTVWIQKMNPVEASTAMRRADAAKARKLTARYDKESDDYLAVQGQVMTLTPEEQVDLLCTVERFDLMPKVEEELSHEERWAKDNYLQGLRDAWLNGLVDTYVEEPDHEEAKRVHDELDRFLDEVNEALEEKVADHRLALSTLSEQELLHAATEHFYKQIGDAAWLDEFHKCQIWLGTRDEDDHKSRLFENRDDIDDIQAPLFAQLREAFQELTVEPVEGKDSAGNPPSSESSESQEQPATANSSGQGG